MGELRKDYVLERYVVIAPAREKRPMEFIEQEHILKRKCEFCTEKKFTGKGKKDGGIRWIKNKFPALTPKGKPGFKTKKGFFSSSPAYGYQEIIIDTPNHKKRLEKFSAKELEELLRVYSCRIDELSKKKNIKYVCVFKNHGSHAGTSMVHPHSQVIATGFVPSLVKAEAAAAKKFGKCPYCKIVELERKSPRKCFENNSFLAFAPYASRYNYEIWIFPKKHITQLSQANFQELAQVLRKVLGKLAKQSYNFCLHYSPKGQNLHFHIEIAPKIALWGGFELSTDTIINSVSPEQAAKFYREK